MSGHSKWSTIKRQKGAKDAARGAVFTKLGNMIALAAKSGGDPTTNFSLRLAIDKAKAANMPNANVERSIKRGSGELGGSAIEEVTYEGYGPGGIALIIECATDNRNRTLPEVRTALIKHGGTVAEAGAVAFQFKRRGVISVAKSGSDDEDQLAIIDAGAEDIDDEGDVWSVQTEPKSLNAVKQALETAGLKVVEAGLAYIPSSTITISDQPTVDKILRLMDTLDELDDVVEVYSNFDILDKK